MNAQWTSDDRPGRLDASALRVAGHPRGARPRLRLVRRAAQVGPRPVRARVRRRSPPWPSCPSRPARTSPNLPLTASGSHSLVAQSRRPIPPSWRREASSAVRPSSGAQGGCTRGFGHADRLPCDTLRRRRRPRGFPWLVAIWLVGVCVCSIRLAGGWWHTRRLVREDAFEADEAWVRAVERLSMRLRLRTPVRLLESARVQVPIVIGSLNPVLLLPACGDDRALAAANRSRPGA